MKKRLVLVLTVCLSLLLAACGIPQEDYDDVIAERDAAMNAKESAETKVTSLETELSTVQSQIASLKSELAITQILVDLLGDMTRVETDAPRTTSTSSTAFSKYGFSFDYPQGSSPMELGLLGNNADDNSGMVQVYLEGAKE